MTEALDSRPAAHAPVMVGEVLEALAPRDGGVYVDGTFGAGGYSRAILDAAECRVFAIDRDPLAVALGRDLASRYAGRLTIVEGRFADMDTLLGARGISEVAGIALDIGVSSMQIDDAGRGFSFMRDGPLDMRMEQAGMSAADVVNTVDEGELADILFRFGDERRSRAVARAIARARKVAPIERTRELAAIVGSVVKGRPGHHPATRTFQALRIYVNGEIEQLARGLGAAERLLAPGGRLVVVSFHSVEDRMVKEFFSERSGAASRPSRHVPMAANDGPAPSFRRIGRGAVKPSQRELEINPRARSARLRAAERTSAPAWDMEVAA